MVLQLYADECVDARVVAGLRRRAVIVTTAADEDLLGASDETPVGEAIRAIAVVATVLDPKHMVNWIEWIP